jgi:hypothetical protein
MANENAKQMHAIYLPFTEEQVKEHFIKAKDSSQDSNLKYYQKSIGRYDENYKEEDIASIRQIEKDEKFWTISTLLTLRHSDTFKKDLKRLLISVYGEKPPVGTFQNWDECLDGEIEVFFEPNFSAPKDYKKMLQEKITERQFIPYILEKAKAKKEDGTFRADLEGPTNVDALILNTSNGFNIVIEAKVLSDISYMTTNDSIRNQIARTIDVMLEEPHKNAHEPLDKRDPEKSLFLLITPQLFKDKPETRLYGYKMNEYRKDNSKIQEDIPSRNIPSDMNSRIGWTSWEELKAINKDCCKWLDK